MGLLLSFSPSRYVHSDPEGMPTGTRLPPELWAPQPRTCPKPPNPAAFAQLLCSEHQPDGAQDKNPHSELITCLSSMLQGEHARPVDQETPLDPVRCLAALSPKSRQKEAVGELRELQLPVPRTFLLKAHQHG